MDAEGSFGLPNGTKAQITAIAIMSAITLHMIISMSVAVEIRRGHITHKGCKDSIPNLDANVPVMNGNSAAPVNPNPPIQPMDPVRSHGGIRRPDSFMRMGYMGPKKNPTKETAIASPTSEGTSHTINSSLR